MILRNALFMQKGAEEHFPAWQYFIGSEAAAWHFDQETVCSKSIFLKVKGVMNTKVSMAVNSQEGRRG